jgi:hypothetical protein
MTLRDRNITAATIAVMLAATVAGAATLSSYCMIWAALGLTMRPTNTTNCLTMKMVMMMMRRVQTITKKERRKKKKITARTMIWAPVMLRPRHCYVA